MSFSLLIRYHIQLTYELWMSVKCVCDWKCWRMNSRLMIKITTSLDRINFPLAKHSQLHFQDASNSVQICNYCGIRVFVLPSCASGKLRVRHSLLWHFPHSILHPYIRKSPKQNKRIILSTINSKLWMKGEWLTLHLSISGSLHSAFKLLKQIKIMYCHSLQTCRL